MERWASVDHVVTSLDEFPICLAHSHLRSPWWRVFVRPSGLKSLTARFWGRRFPLIRPFVPSGRGFALLAFGGPRRLWSPDCQTVQAGRPFFRLWPAFAYILLSHLPATRHALGVSRGWLCCHHSGRRWVETGRNVKPPLAFSAIHVARPLATSYTVVLFSLLMICSSLPATGRNTGALTCIISTAKAFLCLQARIYTRLPEKASTGRF